MSLVDFLRGAAVGLAVGAASVAFFVMRDFKQQKEILKSWGRSNASTARVLRLCILYHRSGIDPWPVIRNLATALEYDFACINVAEDEDRDVELLN